MSRIELTVLGSGTCAATLRRSMASYHLQAGAKQALLDIGAGAIRRLLDAGKDYREIDSIFITHRHIDHIADLVPYLWAVRYTPHWQREKPLVLYGPPGTERWYHKLAAAHGDWMLQLPFPLEIHEGESMTWDWFGHTVRTLPMYHLVPVNGYRFTFGDTIFAYTGDTGYHKNVTRLAENADWLLAECSFPSGKAPIDTHLTPDTAGQIARESGVKRLILTHMYPECDAVDLVAQCKAVFSGEVERAEDLQRFLLG